jgi:predicted NBD/HSP70 family sugar kinase
MYLGIDIGGTKTLVATLTDEGVITEQVRFETPEKYDEFESALAKTVAQLSTDNFLACGVGFPGKLDRKNGIGLAMGNLPWENVPIERDIKRAVHCPVVIDNDANLAGLSEAMLVKDNYDRVLYITVSTGIGTGIIMNQEIEPAFADSEGGQMMLERNDKMEIWEDFASGSAIVRRYGKQAKDITSEANWEHITYDLAIGMINLIAIIQPQVIIIGGSVGCYLEKYEAHLLKALRAYETPLVRIPPIIKAQRPTDAVLYGCYDLAKNLHGKAR